MRGSEPGIGWNICSRLANFHDVTVLSSPGVGDEDNRGEYEQFVRQHGAIAGLDIHFVHMPPLSRWFQRPHVSFAAPLYFVGYAAWQRAAFKEARRLHCQKPFDLAHQLTITGFREPGYLWKLPIPFVWGPVAGASDIPWSYFPMLGSRDRLFYTLKNIVNGLHKRTKFRSRRAARAARHIFVNAEDNRALITDRWGCSSEMMLDTGSPPPAAAPRQFDGSRPLRIVWSGLHVGRKALPLLLHAMAKSAGPMQLTVLGAGRETTAWKSLAASLGIEKNITWPGHLPRDQAMRLMSDADLFAFTSLQEGTSNVVMEALSLGLPIICHNACGMGVAVDDTCGIRIPMSDPATSIAGFAAALARFQADPSLVARFSAGALARAEELSWDRKAAHIAAVYEKVLSQNSDGR
ncbi:MAG TPA: glycosyltransferase family 4 protein [Tepidisphaeraceae bacterium]|nr:glycosyltransferase family 4 protein [Tepidisphaeraceae bacterium]